MIGLVRDLYNIIIIPNLEYTSLYPLELTESLFLIISYYQQQFQSRRYTRMGVCTTGETFLSLLIVEKTPAP